MTIEYHETAELPALNPSGEASVRPIRVLFNTLNPRLRGGPPTHLPILEQALRSLVEVHTYEYGRKSDSETLVRKIFGRLGDLVQLWALCRKLHPDLIHHNSAFDHRAILRDAPLVLLAKWQKVPVLLKLHGSFREAFCGGSWLVSRARQTVLRGVDRIGVLSETERQEFEDAVPYLRGKVCVVKNIINSTFAKVERKEAERPTVLFLSRVIKKKGPFDLLHAAPLVLREEPEAQFLFVGDGEDAEAFDREVSHMNLGEAVRRIPGMDNRATPSVYAMAWVFAFPTHFPEGMPMAIGEAMAAGIPIASTPTRFSRSYMTEGVHVLYNGVGDIDGMASNILRLFRDSGLRKRMSAANRSLALECFMAEDVAREYVDLYRGMSRSASRQQARDPANCTQQLD
jgi:glycosyltransferase involved in cell wall biosynthesis